MKKWHRLSIVLMLLFNTFAFHSSGQRIKSTGNKSAKKYNPDSLKAVSSNLTIPTAYGKVILEQYDKVIDLIFLPNPPCFHNVSTVPGDTGEYIWILTSETNDPKVRSDGGSCTDPNRSAEPGSHENYYTIGMATYKQSNPSFSVIGFENLVKDSTVPAKNFLPYWKGFVSLFHKVGNKYVITNMRFEYGWEYLADGTKKYNVFDLYPSVKENKTAYDYHLKVSGAYPKIIPSEPAKNSGQ